MKRLALLSFAVLVAFAGTTLAATSVQQPIAPPANLTISPGEEKTWGPIKEGEILRIYCPSGEQPLAGIFSQDQAKMVDLMKFRSGLEKFKGVTEKPGVGPKTGKVLGVNIYCTKSLKGPWRWIACTVNAYYPFKLAGERELGYTPEFYMFEVQLYQYTADCLDRGLRPIVTIKVSPAAEAKAGNPKKTENGEITASNSYAISAQKLIDAIKGTNYISPTASNYFRDNPFVMKSLIDSAKIFALSAKTEPELAAIANTALPKIGALEQYLNANSRRIINLPEAALAKELGAIREKLIQTVEVFASPGSNLAVAEKTPRPKAAQ